MTVWRVLRSPFEPGSRAITAALVLLLLAAFLPQVNLPRKAYSYIVVFDITQSMNVEDYDLDGMPVSRLAFAKEAVRRSLRRLPCGSRIGWGAFAEYRTILLLAPVEVCANYNDLLASLDRIDGRMRWANASEIRKGVYWAMRAAKETGGHSGLSHADAGQREQTGPGTDPSETDQAGASQADQGAPGQDVAVHAGQDGLGPRGAARTLTGQSEMGQPDVLFLTDGQEAPPEVGPGLPLFDDLKRGEVHGWLVGVGGYTPRRIPRTDDDGRSIGYWRSDEVIQPDDLVNDNNSATAGGTPNTPGTSSGAPSRRATSHEELSELREPHLRTLAQEVGFEYTHLTSLESIDAAMQDSRFARRRPAPTDLGWMPTLAALLMLAIRFRPSVRPPG